MSNKTQRNSLNYEAPEVTTLEISIDTIICLSDGAYLNDLKEVPETW